MDGRYEYLVIELPTSLTRENFREALNGPGREGWGLVETLVYRGKRWAIFERGREEGSVVDRPPGGGA